jgi:uncharacterized protein (DUF1330 family)
MPTYIDPERAQFHKFKALPRDQPIEMINLVAFREQAQYPLGHACAAQGVSGAQAYSNYGRESGPVFNRVGGSIVWSGKPLMVLIGPIDEAWDTAFIARYPTASAFLEMVTDPAYRLAVIHRQAGVRTSRLIRCDARRSTDSFG